jgi:hypothetical protein
VESKQPSENQKWSAGPQKKQAANKASDQSMQEEIVNSNAMDDMFVAFTMVQQVMTGLSNAASEGEKDSIITVMPHSFGGANGTPNSILPSPPGTSAFDRVRIDEGSYGRKFGSEGGYTVSLSIIHLFGMWATGEA